MWCRWSLALCCVVLVLCFARVCFTSLRPVELFLRARVSPEPCVFVVTCASMCATPYQTADKQYEATLLRRVLDAWRLSCLRPPASSLPADLALVGAAAVAGESVATGDGASAAAAAAAVGAAAAQGGGGAGGAGVAAAVSAVDGSASSRRGVKWADLSRAEQAALYAYDLDPVPALTLPALTLCPP